ncbi:MAG: tryptophan synthase subunit alpha [Paludibacteraceae bacterium]|nr:tryptophan synthase subunit alpha [Paludibacteraceae bacterium]
MDRIKRLFDSKKNEKILSVYFTAGFPKKDSTVDVIKALSDGGVDMIEIGIPFSDPMADGPVIQQSSQKALDNGMTQNLLFEQLKDIRKVTDIPLILMGYINTAMQFGFENLCKKAVEVGIDGFIIPDIPLEEYSSQYKPIVEKYGLKFILLITPETPEERIRKIDSASSGFIYMVSSASTTGAQNSFSEDKQRYFKKIADMNLKNPTLVGFGVSNKATFDAACEHSRGAIIGSAFIRALEEQPTVQDAVKSLISKL